MKEFWENIGSVLFIVLVFGGWVITSVVASIVKNWRLARESEHLAALKQSMIERGMAADEIERVINAGRTNDKLTDLKAKMVAQGMSAKEIERVLLAGNSEKTEEEHV
jgi:aspartokinase-like uncharacterized kinase